MYKIELIELYDEIDTYAAAELLRQQDVRGGVWTPLGHGPDADEPTDHTGEE